MPTLNLKSAVLILFNHNIRKNYTIFITVKFWQPQLSVFSFEYSTKMFVFQTFWIVRCLQSKSDIKSKSNIHNLDVDMNIYKS